MGVATASINQQLRISDIADVLERFHFMLMHSWHL